MILAIAARRSKNKCSHLTDMSSANNQEIRVSCLNYFLKIFKGHVQYVDHIGHILHVGNLHMSLPNPYTRG